ncbi:MAG TPA: antibiotic biosynthesis monooxygenase [Actinomycetota bacterium]|nr:antibiotic biosynthesis monooxygenase [Actinomycetota bacterium]
MSYVVINAITVPSGNREELERRFANRAGEVSKAEGFEAFELLRPANEGAGDRYFVYTRWASKDAFEGWMKSAAFQHGHRQSGEGGSERPAGTGSEVLAYEVIQREEKA